MNDFTKNMLINDWIANVNDIIKEVKEYDFKDVVTNDIDKDQFVEIVGERIWESIDGSQEVIYTYQAKQVCEVLDIDIFGCDEMTGDRYESWSHAAFSGIHNLINDEFDIDNMVNEYIESLLK